MTPHVVVFVTVPSAREANRLSRALVKERLVACANAVPGVRSVYRWKGRVETASEQLLVLKTRKSKFPALRRRIRRLHPYAVPEIIALPIAAGHKAYLDWIDESLRPRR